MSLSSEVKALYGSQVRFVRRVGIVGEWVNVASPDIFRVENGTIRVVVFYGKVTALFGAGASQLQARITVAIGAAGTQLLSNPCGALNAAAINSTIVPDGAVPAGAFTLETTLGVTVGNMTNNQWILLPGIIDMLVSGATNDEGAIDFCMGYIPLENGATVTVL